NGTDTGSGTDTGNVTDTGNAADTGTNSGNNNSQPARVAVSPRVPSYVVAATATYHQGNQIKDIFLDNVWKDNKQGFYVIQSHTSNEYNTDRSFVNYGYGYKGKQNTTLFGGYVPLTANTELHAAVGFGKQTIEPKAADGYSKGKYKTVSGLVSINNKWDNVLLNVGVGYHRHSGDISASGIDKVAKVKSNQHQVFTQFSYEIPFGQLTVTPMLGLSYQNLNTQVNDKDWNVEVKDYNVFSQQVGSNFSWKADSVRFNLGVFYENVNSSVPQVRILPVGDSAESFSGGKLGNNIVVKASSEVTLLPNLTLGLQVSHRHALSSAKLKQTNVMGKIEYKF
ncbi:autotransporter outer membrane beta-barrel domain-containing protein, partial [Mannheimia indoligenes]|uniref:autotransporter outer membrane beta-barrel domain-containing protein n=1 Tax=Mannheimia indoligenes TaxID=3103145 RepID=UPI002FE580C9